MFIWVPLDGLAMVSTLESGRTGLLRHPEQAVEVFRRDQCNEKQTDTATITATIGKEQLQLQGELIEGGQDMNHWYSSSSMLQCSAAAISLNWAPSTIKVCQLVD